MPRLKSVAQVAVIWLLAMAGALAFSPGDGSATSLIWKVVLVGFCLAGAFYMVKVSREIDVAEDNLSVFVGNTLRENSELRDSDRKAA
jgi:hypothetical protein